MTTETIQAVCVNMRTMRNFVPPARQPASPFRLGWDAYEAGLAETDVPVEARRGWRAANRAQAYAEGSAYLVAAGVTA